MNIKRLLLVLLAVAIVMIAAWYVVRGVVANPEPTLIGGQKDAHGCLAAAGYSWCEAKQACVRPWETYCTAAAPKSALFTCSGDKTIDATFYPTDDRYVDLVLSDGTKISLAHATSGSGARYAKLDDSFVFWNKGDTAFITENGTTTYADCVTKVQ